MTEHDALPDDTPAGADFAPGDADWRATLVATPADWDAAVDLRMAVFVDEQGVPEGLELDEHDEEPLDSAVDHVLVRDRDGDAVAVARLRAVDAGEYGALAPGTDRLAKVERVAVDRHRRGGGWGARAMRAVESRARERGLPEAVLHAQTHAAGFYERLGYAVDDAVGAFDEDGIEHVRMRRRL
ncbi:GNAT family N-acetyltransferase [Halobaculum gomorrense]|uniref:Predicted N-acyltransferase, GNAT family n=1 Tax=Halobaculum gomorrense TaxID=43928 RepID=A0A1M5V5G5_9EURY|nr:GNAT family N-acetyltransferase [Halobaculum gomorrense]SHH70471.1 Predicted N-acyltransferase, GNAT family [Halobaculum gomorrense]